MTKIAIDDAYKKLAYWQDMFFLQPSKYRRAKMIAAEQEYLHLLSLYISNPR